MEYRVLEQTDLELSNICLGSAGFGDKLTREQSFEILDAFVERGGNFIDTANVYCKWIPGAGNCSERIVGEWLKKRGAYKNVVIATKGAHYDFEDPERRSRVSEAEIRKDLEESLRTLGLETVDFYWLHRDDTDKPIEEIMDIMEKLKKEGKIRYYGLSNYQISRAEEARKYLESKGLQGPYAISNQWSLADVNPGKNVNPDPTLVEFGEEEYLWHKKTRIPSVPFSSTAMGFFDKVYRMKETPMPESIRAAYWNEENLKKYEALLKLHEEKGYDFQAMSVAWLLCQPFQVFPVCGVRTIEQLEGVIAGCGLKDFQL